LATNPAHGWAESSPSGHSIFITKALFGVISRLNSNSYRLCQIGRINGLRIETALAKAGAALLIRNAKKSA